jgi:predicted SnoaL-like aldol condensation-catalyzing enzyme
MTINTATTKKLANATALYLEGIQQGRAREAVEAYTGDRYTQHSTGVRDGVEGFVEFFEPFIERNPQRDIQVIRAIEDGAFVFLHVSQSLNGGQSRWITTDMFDTDANDRIIEHWDVISEWVDETVSGHSQIDGPTEITDLDRTESNRAVVTEFIDRVLVNGEGDRMTDFVSADTYIQHNPQVADGIEGIGAFMAQMAEAGTPMIYKYVYKVLAQGNFVASYCLAQFGQGDGAQDMAVFDIFRLENGLIVEHWDNMEPLPSGDMLVNQGKF